MRFTISDNNHKAVQNWLVECLRPRQVKLKSVCNIKQSLEREVWDCELTLEGTKLRVILTIFKPDSLQTVNASLPPDQTAQKCMLVMNELPSLGIPTPHVCGGATIGLDAGFVCEKLERTDWTSNIRLEAARILAHIHNLDEDSLSEELRQLARQSDPHKNRTTSGRSSKPQTQTLVHGDYFSANILPTADGLCIIDWETFGWGDSMWDLGFLIGADRGLPGADVEAVIAQYEKHAPVNRDRLMWHQQSWFDFWRKREQP